ncbi:hypothetical protein ACS0TY_009583 [Phlomoides rotata]
MEQNLHSPSSSDEDYISMEVSHHSSFDSSSIFSQSTSKEFEFQSFSSSSDRDHTTTSPADELFYMGKLLPLHLPPRLQMVHKILEIKSANASFDVLHDVERDERFSTPLFTPSSNTPFESCNISPSESCHVSGELDPTRYFAEYYSGFECKEIVKPCPKKLNMIKQPSKMKWTSYLKSLFGKSSGCSDEHSAAADQRQFANGGGGSAKKPAPFGQIKCGKENSGHRRSFSGAFKRLSKAKTASSAVNLNRSFCKRSIGTSSEIDSPIQAAIAHCKRSQNSRQIGDEFCSINSASSRRLCD